MDEKKIDHHAGFSLSYIPINLRQLAAYTKAAFKSKSSSLLVIKLLPLASALIELPHSSKFVFRDSFVSQLDTRIFKFRSILEGWISIPFTVRLILSLNYNKNFSQLL